MIFLSSDSHFYHNNVIRYCTRPFATVEEMNEAMVKEWNSVVGPDDTVYYLGDFSLAFRAVEIFSFRLNGRKLIVPGNHDFCHSYHKKSRSVENREKWLQKYRDYGWEILPEQTTLDIPGLATFNLCHHPYSGQYELTNGDKYARWRPVDDGRILLNGHVHETWKTRRSPKGTLMINVGVDVWNFRPVSVEQLKELIEQENG